jgi:hypothetical protein
LVSKVNWYGWLRSYYFQPAVVSPQKIERGVFMMTFFKYCREASWALGAGKVSILRECPSEGNKFSVSAILNIMSSIIGGTALYQALAKAIGDKLPLPLLPIAVFYGVLLFLITYGLSLNMAKTRSAIAIRVCISLLFTALSVQVVEILFFEDFLPIARRDGILQETQRLETFLDSKHEELYAAENALKAIDEKIQVFQHDRNSIFNADPILLGLLQQQQVAADEAAATETNNRVRNDQGTERIAVARRSLASVNTEINYLQQNNIAGQRLIELQSRAASYTSTINHELAEINRRNTATAAAKQRTANYQPSIDERMRFLDAGNTEIQHNLDNDRTAVAMRVAAAQGRIDLARDENQTAADETFNEGFLSDVLSIGYLVSRLLDPSASFTERSRSVMIILVRLVLFGIFIIIDISPLLVIYLAGTGVYEQRILKEKEVGIQVADFESLLSFYAKQKAFKVKLIEKDIEKCFKMAKALQVQLDQHYTESYDLIRTAKEKSYYDEFEALIFAQLKETKEKIAGLYSSLEAALCEDTYPQRAMPHV